MKKNSVIKAIVITFLIYVLLSWIVPGGTFVGGVLSNKTTSPVGISDIIFYPFSTFMTSIFALIGIVILLIGGLYGVMNKTGAYQNLVEATTNKFKGKETKFLVISILVFAILASLTTLTLPLLVLVPFFIAVILSLGYNKMTAMLSTVGAILVGNMGTVFGYNYGGYSYLKYFFDLKTTESILYKVILFVLLTGVLLFYVIKTSKIAKPEKKSSKKKETVSEEKEILLYKKDEKTKKGFMPLVIVVLVAFVVGMVAMYNWSGALNVDKTIFMTWYENITNVKLNGYPIFANILGTVPPFGQWSNYEFAMLLVILIIVIGFIYNLSVKDTFESVVEGMKEVLYAAVIAVLANILFVVIMTSINNGAPVFTNTIYNLLFKMTKGLNAITMSIVSIVGSIGFNDFPYFVNSVYTPVSSLYASNFKEVAYIMQAMHGFTMMLVPTSVGLVVGLQLLGISYKEWLKENWKLLLSLFTIGLILSFIVVVI